MRQWSLLHEQRVPSPFDFAHDANNNNNENDLFNNNNNIDNSMGSHDILNDINQAAILHKRSGDKVDKARGKNMASPFSTTSSSYIGLLSQKRKKLSQRNHCQLKIMCSSQ